MPLLLRLAMNSVASSSEYPICLRAVALFLTSSASWSTPTPVFCEAAVRTSRYPPALSADRLKDASVAWTLSTDVLTFVPLMSANLMKSLESCLSLSSVTSNFVLTSPTASAAFANDVGMEVARSSQVFCRLSAASPVAPVFLMMVS